MAKKSEVIHQLIEMSKWRAAARHAAKQKRWDLVFQYQDNALSCVAAALKASIGRSVNRRKQVHALPSKIGVEQVER